MSIVSGSLPQTEIAGVADRASPTSLQPVPQGRTGLRLLAPAGTLGTLRDAPIVAHHARSRGVVRRLETIYYDTGERTLFAHGLSLRVQKQGARFTQSLRQHGRAAASWEWPLQDATPDLVCLSQAASLLPTMLPTTLIEQLTATPLSVMFQTRLRRQLRRLDLSGALVEMAFDEGVIEAASREETVSEIRLMLQVGEVGVLYEIGMRLLELAPLRVSTASTWRRGYALASGERPRAERASASTVTRDAVVDDMVAAVLAGCAAHLQANQAVAEDGTSPDGVHQMRVALRRMRTAFSLLRHEVPSTTMQALSAEAKWLADQLGEARGWDVFLATTLAEPARLQSTGADFDGLRRSAEPFRLAGYAAAREAITSARYGRFQLLLSQWIARRGWRNEVDREGLGVLAEPAQRMALRVLHRLHRKARRRGGNFKALSPEQRHDVRITLKKLRYATEFFQPLCAEPDQAHRYAVRLGALQDWLGLDHDAATTQPLLDALARASRSLGVHQAIGIVTGWQGRDGLAARRTLLKRWRRFKSLPPYWTRPGALIEAARSTADAS